MDFKYKSYDFYQEFLSNVKAISRSQVQKPPP